MTVQELYDELKKLLEYQPDVATLDVSVETSVDYYSIRCQVCYAHYDGLNVTLSAY